MDRRKTNLAIMRELASLIEANPDQRFLQLLCNCNAIEEFINIDGMPEFWQNEYHTESEVTLKRILNSFMHQKMGAKK